MTPRSKIIINNAIEYIHELTNEPEVYIATEILGITEEELTFLKEE